MRSFFTMENCIHSDDKRNTVVCCEEKRACECEGMFDKRCISPIEFII